MYMHPCQWVIQPTTIPEGQWERGGGRCGKDQCISAKTPHCAGRGRKAIRSLMHKLAPPMVVTHSNTHTHTHKHTHTHTHKHTHTHTHTCLPTVTSPIRTLPHHLPPLSLFPKAAPTPSPCPVTAHPLIHPHPLEAPSVVLGRPVLPGRLTMGHH